MAAPKILVGMPTRGYPYVLSILHALELSRSLSTTLALQVGSPVDIVRNRIVRSFLATDATHLLTMDDDIVPPVGCLGRLVEMGVPVATAPCPILTDGRIVANVKGLRGDRWLTSVPPEIFPVKHTGLGCTLIRRDVLERIEHPWFAFRDTPDGTTMGEDVWFSWRARKEGFQIFCDGGLLCRHVKNGLDLLEVSGWLPKAA